MPDKILLVDNSALIRKVLKRYLSESALSESETIEAEDGRQALTKVETELPFAIFLDLNMPILDGFQFLRELKKSSPDYCSRVVVCSTEGGEVRDKELEALGIFGKLLKPIKEEEVKKIAAALKAEFL